MFYRIALCALLCSLAHAGEAAPNAEPVRRSVFSNLGGRGDQAVSAAAAEFMSKQKYAEAERLLTDAAKSKPSADVLYNLACAQAMLKKTEAALANLGKSIDSGFFDAVHMENDSDFDSLRNDERFTKLVERARILKVDTTAVIAAPAIVKEGVATVDEGNTGWDAEKKQLLPLFKFDDADVRRTADAVVAQGKTGELIRQWQREGTAAGLFGVLYDNHDGDHSNMNGKDFPQLTFVEYSEEAKKSGAHYGLQHRLFFNHPTLGNSSTAQTQGPLWRSMTRMGQSNAMVAAIQANHYLNNQMYFYPEHRDYDPGRNGVGDGYGDTFPTNTPYVVTSQGSSGSDQVFLRAFACGIAALRPETRAAAVKHNLLAPTMQMLFRSSNKQVVKPEDYLTGKAHPVVFQGPEIDAERMARMAHESKSDELPPVVLLKLHTEESPRPGIDYFEANGSQKFFDTPCAIARIYRTINQSQNIEVSAAETKDANGRPLTFRWVLLQGMAERVEILPTPDGSRAQIRMKWHERFPLEANPKMESNRVDIGVFAHNGIHWSAPAFVTFYFADSETRKYDAQGRIESIEYKSRDAGGNYVDPAIYTARDWRDDYRRDKEGRICGWTRTRKDVVEEFNSEGMLIIEKDNLGRAKKARAVVYQKRIAKPKTSPILESVPTGAEVEFAYDSDADLIGHPVQKK